MKYLKAYESSTFHIVGEYSVVKEVTCIFINTNAITDDFGPIRKFTMDKVYPVSMFGSKHFSPTLMIDDDKKNPSTLEYDEELEVWFFTWAKTYKNGKALNLKLAGFTDGNPEIMREYIKRAKKQKIEHRFGL